MNKYLVLKFGESEIYVYIVKAENPKYAITLIFGNAKYIGSFTVNNSFGEGAVVFELTGEEYDVSWLTKPLEWFVENQSIMQNNN